MPNVLVLNITLSWLLKLRCVDFGLSSVLTPLPGKAELDPSFHAPITQLGLLCQARQLNTDIL